MASTLPLDFSWTRRPPWNPWAEFVNNTLSIVGRLGLEFNPQRLPPGESVLCRIPAAIAIQSLISLKNVAKIPHIKL
jgi:hypothetical protein